MYACSNNESFLIRFIEPALILSLRSAKTCSFPKSVILYFTQSFEYFLNLKLDKAKVHPLPRQKQRICYMLFAVSHTIALSDSPRHWIESMLELCDISVEYYDKHHKDFLSVGVSDKNKEYKEIIDESIKRS